MASQRKGLVLLGEDDWAQSDVLLEVLMSEGYNVLSATNPPELVSHLDAHPDLVLLDVRGVSSPEVLQALTVTNPRPALVVVSADTHVDDFAREVSADAFIRKPYELDDLLETVSRLLQARQRDMRAS